MKMLREYAKTIVLAIVVLLSVLPHGSSGPSIGSFVWVAATAFFLPWAVYSLFRIVFRPAERRSRSIRLAIWAVTIAIIVAATGHWDAVARQEADSAVSAIVAHKNRTGAYPASLADVGIDPQVLREKYSLRYRVDNDGKPALFYSQPSMPMIAHHYDFAHGRWFQLD
ncbi:MAG TPA: hypothetical protein VF795_09315 [Desulfuromonadaceae bacterium]